MSQRADLHKCDAKLKHALGALDADEGISPANNKAIRDFVTWNQVKGNSANRALKYFYYSKSLAKLFGRDFETATKDDLKQLVLQVEKAGYGSETIRDMRICLKLLFKSILGTGDEIPDIVKWITSGKKKRGSTPRTMILEQTEIKRMAATTQDLQMRLLILMTYYTGGRITEVLSLQLKDLRISNGFLYAELTTFKLDNRKRNVPIGDSYTIRAYDAFLQAHPDRTNPESLLFREPDGTQAQYRTFNRRMKEIARAAKIFKPVNFHHFRHSRFTHLAEEGFSEQMLRYLGGWNSSDMLQRYISSSEKLVQEQFFKL